MKVKSIILACCLLLAARTVTAQLDGGRAAIRFNNPEHSARTACSLAEWPNIRDLNATILHLMGIDHERFTVKHRGLDERLTGVQQKARIVCEIFA